MGDLMKAYRVSVLGLYLGETEIDPYQGIPNDIVLTAPPEPIEGKFRVYRDYAWIYTDEEPKPYVPPIEPWQVDQERDRRVSLGFIYNGKAFMTESQSQIDDILGKMTDSLAATLVDGAVPGNFHWASPDYEFAWSAADGTLVPMDAQTCLEFTRAAVRRKTALVAAGLVLKAMDPIPQDYWQDQYWPPMDATAKVARK